LIYNQIFKYQTGSGGRNYCQQDPSLRNLA